LEEWALFFSQRSYGDGENYSSPFSCFEERKRTVRGHILMIGAIIYFFLHTWALIFVVVGLVLLKALFADMFKRRH